jgi:hypothetical protein
MPSEATDVKIEKLLIVKQEVAFAGPFLSG